MRKFFTVLAALAMSVGITATAWAAEPLQNPQNVTITFPETPEFEITLENVYDQYLITQNYSNTYNIYTFFFAGNGTLKSNADFFAQMMFHDYDLGEDAIAGSQGVGNSEETYSFGQIGSNGTDYETIGFSVLSDGFPETREDLGSPVSDEYVYQLNFVRVDASEIPASEIDGEDYTLASVSDLIVGASATTETPEAPAPVLPETVTPVPMPEVPVIEAPAAVQTPVTLPAPAPVQTPVIQTPVTLPAPAPVAVVDESVPFPVGSTAVVDNCYMLNVRKGAGASHAAFTYIVEGDVITVLEYNSNKWVKISTPKGEGWIYSGYLTRQ